MSQKNEQRNSILLSWLIDVSLSRISTKLVTSLAAEPYQVIKVETGFGCRYSYRSRCLAEWWAMCQLSKLSSGWVNLGIIQWNILSAETCLPKERANYGLELDIVRM